MWPGEPFPLGPDWDGQGTNFAIFSENADRVELCLFDEHGAEDARLVMRRGGTTLVVDLEQKTVELGT